MRNVITRRGFLRTTVAGAAGLAVGAAGGMPGWAGAQESAGSAASAGGAKRLRKAVKLDAVKPGTTLLEKFELLKSFGIEGVEINSPSDVNKEEAVAARDKTGVEIHGVIDSIHWKTRLSDPKEEVRAEGLEALKGALRDAKFYGASTVLLVPGKVDQKNDESYEKVWERSTAEVRKAIPTAEETGVKIGIEVVWNNFITKPEQLVNYVDQFNSPWVGAYFDASNMVKFGVPSAEWIRALGKRMLKLDFKGYSNEKKWVKIGEGDENWPAVLKALEEIGYRGWATAEVPLGSVEEIKDVSARMDRVLGLKA